MTSKLAVPEVGNTVIVQVETKNHQCMELGGIIEEIATENGSAYRNA